jgi:spermidine synthase
VSLHAGVDSVDEFAAGLRRDLAIKTLYPLFFVSGATALIYQTIWARQLNRVFGTSTLAIATVLAAFMAGLAIGGFWMARQADSLKRPLRTYGLLEIGIGLYGLVFPWILELIIPVYLSLWGVLGSMPSVYTAAQFLLVGTALVIPTTLMGATLPILARFATRSLGAVGDKVGNLYSVNTAGAVFGTWLGGFYLLPIFGLWRTTIIAAGANGLLGVCAWLLGSWSNGVNPVRAESVDDGWTLEMRPSMNAVALCLALAGFSSLVYEVAWFRLMGLMLGASVYAFSVMLLAFLLGIAIGGKLGGVWGDQVLRTRGQVGVLQLIALCEVGVALLSFALMYLYQELPVWYVWLFDAFNGEERVSSIWIISLMLSGLVMTPPAVLMGAVFPLGVRAVTGDTNSLGAVVGRLYGVNTLGAVFGAALAGFVFLPLLKVQGTVFLAGAINIFAALVVVWGVDVRARRRWFIGLSAAVLVLAAGTRKPPWDPLLMTAGMYKYASSFSDHSRAGIMSYSRDKYELLYYKEGLSSVVTVARNRGSDNIWLANNGKVEASTSTDMPTQILCSLLPIQFVEDPSDVLVIGLASGITAGSLTLIDGVDHLNVVELEPAIEEAARIFDEYNFHVLDDPRLNLIHNDGRNQVLLSEPGSFDLIVSEPSNPWITGVSNLFTREFFEIGKSRLKPGGVWSQWVQMYGMHMRDLRSVLNTFASVYPYVAVYTTIEDADIVLLGSDKPLEPSLEAARRLTQGGSGVAKALATVGIKNELDLIALYKMDRDHLMLLAHGAPLNTDDNMLIEYSAPEHLHRDTQTENVSMMREYRIVPDKSMGEDPLVWSDLSQAYYDQDDVARAIAALVIGARYLEEGSEMHAELLKQAREWRAELP